MASSTAALRQATAESTEVVPYTQDQSKVEQCIIPRREFTVRIYIILKKSGKGQIQIDNQRGMIIIRLYKSRDRHRNKRLLTHS
jgi:hypothetical protein